MSQPPIFLLLVVAVFAGGVFGYSYTTKYFKVPVDHFSFGRNDSFRMKYLVNDSYWDKAGGPIFFYTGNEGDIELFANNTGLMWELAPTFKALVVFAEHRYYGASLPFGNRSLTNPQLAGFLTSQQALADFVDLIAYLKSNQTGAARSAVIAFGGSYGGMLAAYIRMKYPHAVDGAIAASAPIFQFPGLVPCEAYSLITTSAYRVESPLCPKLIRRSWGAINALATKDEDLKWLSSEWKLCKNLTAETVSSFKGWLADMYTELAMANYPYPANFLGEFPAKPVKVFCHYLRNETLAGKDLLKTLFHSVSVYFNHTGKAKCLDWQGSLVPLGTDAWTFQTCTEMVMPICSDGVKDMFEKEPWDLKKFSDECWKTWKVRPQPHLVEKTYGGKKIKSASNIIFSNGLLDPWASGGVLTSVNPANNLIAVIIPEGAHHLDLRASNPADPESVRRARSIYADYIRLWVRYKSASFSDI